VRVPKGRKDTGANGRLQVSIQRARHEEVDAVLDDAAGHQVVVGDLPVEVFRWRGEQRLANGRRTTGGESGATVGEELESVGAQAAGDLVD
jgi:hypothetical protein